MKDFFFTLMAAILFFGCGKEKTNPPAESKIYFTGITKTDNVGAVISADTTDWKTNDVWSKKESELFASGHATGCPLPYNYRISAYPNPCRYTFALHIDKQPSTRVELRLVDENFNKLFASDSIMSNNIMFQVAAYGITDTVRLYYKFIENHCEFRGHGDILIQ